MIEQCGKIIELNKRLSSKQDIKIAQNGIITELLKQVIEIHEQIQKI